MVFLTLTENLQRLQMEDECILEVAARVEETRSFP